MVGTTMGTAATVAGPEPDTAAKEHAYDDGYNGKAARDPSKNTLQTFNILLDTLRRSSGSPARINSGIAISGNESALVTKLLHNISGT